MRPCTWCARGIWTHQNWKQCNYQGVFRFKLRQVVRLKRTRKQLCGRPRLGFTRDGAAPWRHSVSPTSWQTLENHWYSYEWIEGRKPNFFIHRTEKHSCHTKNYVPIAAPGLSGDVASSSSISAPVESHLPGDNTPPVLSLGKTLRRSRFFPKSELEVKNSILLHMSQKLPRNKHYDVLIVVGGLLDTATSSSSASAPVETSTVKRWWSRNHHCTARSVASSVRIVGGSHWKLGGRKNFILLERDSRSSRIMSSSSPTKKWFSETTRFTHLPKNPKCEVCKRTAITRAPCTKTNKQSHTSRKECLLTLVTTDHKIPNEDGESHNNQWFAVVVPIWATQSIHSLPRSTKTSHETTRSWETFLDLNPSPSVIYTDNPPKFGEVCE